MRALLRPLALAAALTACTGSGDGGDGLVTPITNAGFVGVTPHCRYESCSSDSECQDCTGSQKLSCIKGICTTSCSDGVSCGSGEVCSPTSWDDDRCVPDCTSGAACPSGLTCQPLYKNGRGGCLPPGEGPSACASVDASSCSPTTPPPFYCGQSYFTVKCGTGYCPMNSTCVQCKNGNYDCCSCQTGYKPACCYDETLCQGECNSMCGDSNWGCLANDVTFYSPGCDGSLSGTTGSCECTNGKRISFSCSSTTTCEKLCAAQAGG